MYGADELTTVIQDFVCFRSGGLFTLHVQRNQGAVNAEQVIKRSGPKTAICCRFVCSMLSFEIGKEKPAAIKQARQSPDQPRARVLIALKRDPVELSKAQRMSLGHAIDGLVAPRLNGGEMLCA